MGWYLSYTPRPPRFLREAGFRYRYRYRRKLSCVGMVTVGFFLLLWQVIRLCLIGIGWVIFGILWCWWWALKDVVLCVIWVVRLIVRAIRKQRPLFPPFLPDEE